MKISNKQLNMWKELWDIFISDGEFRHYYTNSPSYDLDVANKTPITKSKGTLYIPPKTQRGEGHFIAYQMIGDKIEIFDPSAYAYQQFQNNPALQKSISDRSKKTMVQLNLHPQDVCIGDTFCQTWSLAWLDPKLKHHTEGKNTVSSMFEIIHTISKSKKFEEYMLHNEKQFDKIVHESRKKFDVKICVINDTREFLDFSKKMSRDEVERIMMNRT